MSKILITGGTGLVGQRLSKLLEKKGHEVSHLSGRRSGNSGYKTFLWNWENGTIDQEALEASEYIIHLAGAGIFDERWTPARKKLIEDSRVESGKVILDALRKKGKYPKAFICASAVGYYGALTSTKPLVETDDPANDFLGSVCRKWEVMADGFTALGIRTVKIRTGLVIAENAILIKSLSKVIKHGLGAALGSGDQYMPWINIYDLCGIYIKAVEDNALSGAYNAVAPSHVTNREFTGELARLLNKKIWLPNVPAFFLKLVFGERAELLLTGSKISSKKISATGFEFLYPDPGTALDQSVRAI